MMKIAFTGDNHVQINGDPPQLAAMHDKAAQARVFIVGGDMGEGMRHDIGGPCADYTTLLATHPDTMYVMGNHDLYNRNKLLPDEALKTHQALLYPDTALSLEPTWEDTETVTIRDDHAFIGTIGFPDFCHPDLPHPRAYYAHKHNCQTIDPRWIDLREWCDYTDRANVAFGIRLDKAIRWADNIVMGIHYPCLPRHSSGTPGDSVWPYFYNWQLGQLILQKARRWTDKTFWVLAAHSHEYCQGTWGMEAENVYAYGLDTDYHKQDVLVFDTQDDIGTLRK
jgi:hypothetical protein